MKIGFYATGSATSEHDDLLEQIVYADRSRMDSVWLRERHFHPDHQGRNYFSSPLIAAAFIAARTERVRIGIGARLLPLDHPVHIAEAGATVDVISNGRLDFGVARIGENQLYQSAFGVRPNETGPRFQEALDVIVKAWSEPRFSHKGRFYDIPEVSVRPRPRQKPHPPIFLVGISPATLAFGAERGYPLLLAGAQSVPLVRETQEDYYRRLEESGHRREDVVLPVNRFIYVADSNEEAVADTRDTIMHFIHREGSVIRDFLKLPDERITYDLLFNEVCLFGDAETVTRRIEELKVALDLRHLICSFNYFTIDHEKCRRSMRRFVERVMPALRNGD